MSIPQDVRNNLQQLVNQLATALAIAGAVIEEDKDRIIIKIPIIDKLKIALSNAIQQAVQGSTIPLSLSVGDVDVDDVRGIIKVSIVLDINSVVQYIQRMLPIGTVTFKNGELILEMRIR